jgi:hypothetical protein
VPWSCSFRSTFRLLPPERRTESLSVFLGADGASQEDVLSNLPYDRARAAAPGASPNPKRYRDARQLYRTVGLLYDIPDGDTRRVKITRLGKAVERWLPSLDQHNCTVIGRHAALALAACQLKNPTRDGSAYSENVTVFPFSFIWRAMLALDDYVTSDELNRAILKVENEEELWRSVEIIKRARIENSIEIMGDETVSGVAKNDRIISWMSFASFGWTLFNDKRAGGSGSYTIPRKTRRLLFEASRIKYPHREFQSEQEYFDYISRCAALPKDLR